MLMNLQGPVGGTSSEGGCCRGRAVKSIQQMILKKRKLQLIFVFLCLSLRGRRSKGKGREI